MLSISKINVKTSPHRKEGTMTKTPPEPPVPWWCFLCRDPTMRHDLTRHSSSLVPRYCASAMPLGGLRRWRLDAKPRDAAETPYLSTFRPFDLLSICISFIFSNLLNISWWIYFDYFWLGWKSIWSRALIWLGGSEAIGARGFADLKCPNKRLKQLEVQR